MARSLNRNENLGQSQPAWFPAKRRRGSLLGKLTWGVSLSMIGMISAGVGAALTMSTPFLADPASHAQREPDSLGELLQRGFTHGVGRPVNILVMGIDRVPPDSPEAAKGMFAGRSDTMLLARVNPENGTANVLTIPRDTLVDIPNHGSDKINSANVIGGPILSAEVVSRTLDYTPVDRYVRVSTGAFRELVDLVGGIEVFVPKRMQYTDQTQQLFIDLQPGLQTLNGAQAEGFARFRHDELGDIGRTQRQQAVMKALQQRLASPMTIARLPQLYAILQKNIDSDLSLGETLALVQFAIQLKPDQLKMVLLPGRFSAAGEYNASYWLMDDAAAKTIARNFFQTPDTTFNPTTPASVADPKALRIAIQNASSNPNAGQEVANYLMNRGYSNIFIDSDWARQEAKTELIAQRGDEEGAKVLQGVMSLGHVTPDSSGNIDSDITIRIGEDWINRQSVR